MSFGKTPQVQMPKPPPSSPTLASSLTNTDQTQQMSMGGIGSTLLTGGQGLDTTARTTRNSLLGQ